MPRLFARCGLARGKARLGAPGWAGENDGLFEQPAGSCDNGVRDWISCFYSIVHDDRADSIQVDTMRSSPLDCSFSLTADNTYVIEGEAWIDGQEARSGTG